MKWILPLFALILACCSRESKTSYLFFVPSEQGQIKHERDGYTLNLNNVEQILYLTDNVNNRTAGYIEPRDFVHAWSEEDGAPVGNLIGFLLDTAEEVPQEFTISIRNPRYQIDTDSLIFDVDLLDTDVSIPTGHILHLGLFIDPTEKVRSP